MCPQPPSCPARARRRLLCRVRPRLPGVHVAPFSLLALGPVSPRAPQGPQVRRRLFMPGLGFCSAHSGPRPGMWSSPLRGAGVTAAVRAELPRFPLKTLFSPAQKCGWAQQWTVGAGGVGIVSVSFLSRPPVSRAVPCAASCQAWPSPFTARGRWRGPSGGVGSRSDWEVWPEASRSDSLTPQASGGRHSLFPDSCRGCRGRTTALSRKLENLA